MSKKKNSEDYYLASQWTLMARKLKKHKLAKMSFWVLAFLYIVALFGDFFAPYGLENDDWLYKNAAPTSIHWTYEGKFVGPYVYKLQYHESPYDLWDYMLGNCTMEELNSDYIDEDTSEYYKIRLFAHGDEYKILGIIPCEIHLLGLSEGSNGGTGARIYLFGADETGRDVFSRTIHGSKVSLTIPFASAFISFFLGIFMGGISGYFGGAIDMIIQRIIEVIGAVPQIPLWMALSAAIPTDKQVSPIKIYFYITLILSFINWTGMARIVRGKFLSLKNEDYVMAARVAGVSTWNIIWKHLVPGFMSYLIVSLTLGIPGSIVGETSMSYLGLGIKSPATSWGVLLQECGTATNVAACPWKLIPIIFVTITVLAYNFLGDGLRDAADPYK